MHYLHWLVKAVVLGIIITWCAVLSAFSQNIQADIIDTAANPHLFADGVVSSPYTEWATSFTPNGKTVYFSRGAVYWTICSSKMINGAWARPTVVNISGRWRDTDPFITPDGKRMFFISNRPPEGMPQNKPQPNFHVWYAERLAGDEWGVPHYLDTAINSKMASNYGISVNRAGDLYFCSRDREDHAGMSSYCAKWLGGHFDKPKLLVLRDKEEVQDPFIAPYGRYILFESGPDLYICYKNGDGWSPAENLGPKVNNGDSNSSPCISPDGKTLYYSSSRIRGFYKRDPVNHALNYEELEKEMNSDFNNQPNILMVPVNIKKASS
ncbi:hypothetical protein [Mucilaginibacter flavidus]|uniref:hypothetical protein n=1 Tax=Mucilaginibacter flavidus TaxID=2949309 RepID=UPI002093BF62|nr:hypothetical protein [Mucilaginibacter flavidus]MCO5949156.1 hypothetical protein [Mucilaginibacter flavidus]